MRIVIVFIEKMDMFVNFISVCVVDVELKFMMNFRNFEWFYLIVLSYFYIGFIYCICCIDILCSNF